MIKDKHFIRNSGYLLRNTTRGCHLHVLLGTEVLKYLIKPGGTCTEAPFLYSVFYLVTWNNSQYILHMTTFPFPLKFRWSKTIPVYLWNVVICILLISPTFSLRSQWVVACYVLKLIEVSSLLLLFHGIWFKSPSLHFWSPRSLRICWTFLFLFLFAP